MLGKSRPRAAWSALNGIAFRPCDRGAPPVGRCAPTTESSLYFVRDVKKEKNRALSRVAPPSMKDDPLVVDAHLQSVAHAQVTRRCRSRRDGPARSTLSSILLLDGLHR